MKPEFSKYYLTNQVNGTPSSEKLMRSWLDIYQSARQKNHVLLDAAIDSHIRTASSKRATKEEIYTLVRKVDADQALDRTIARIERWLSDNALGRARA